jgi:tetratricopeptide (TPR) repeat protein
VSIFNPTAEAKSRTRFFDFVSPRAVHIGAVFLVAAVCAAAFYPSLYYGFLNYDDDQLYLNNPYFRGLQWWNIRWMFTTFLMGHYQPLTWVTLGLDYAIWGMNPFGYHLTNVVLHVANAVLFYFLALRLIRLASPSWDEVACAVGAAAAALFFAIHPMRVESVAWLTERRDVLSGFFVFLTLHAYLTAAQAESRAARMKWLGVTLFVYALSLLSKAVGMTLPVVLLILDVYPLRRLGGSNERWYGRGVWDVWLEKIPFFILGGVTAVVAGAAQLDTRAMLSLSRYGIPYRAAQVSYAFVFYVWKTLVPTRLSPLYEVPSDFDPTNWIYIVSALIVIAGTAALILVRKIWPAGLAVWIAYLALLLPVSGVAQSGPQLVAVRYSYLPCLGFALLAGGGVAMLWRRARDRAALLAAAAALGAVAVALVFSTRQQVDVWRDTERLWRRALYVDPRTSVAHNDLGNILFKRDEIATAIDHYREAIRLNPKAAMFHFNYGNAMVRVGQTDQAIEQFRLAVELQPNFARGYYNLAIQLAGTGKLDEALNQYRRAVQVDPYYTKAYNNLGHLLVRRGRLEEATAYYRKALAIDPNFAIASANLGYVLVLQEQADAAAQAIDRALAIDPRLATAHYANGALLIHRKQPRRAITEYEKAINGNPDYRFLYYDIGAAYSGLARFKEASVAYEKFLGLYPKSAVGHYDLGITLLKLNQSDAAAEHYRAAIKLDPHYTDAYNNLGTLLDAKGDIAGAITAFRGAIESDPASTTAHFYLANTLHKQGDLRGATEEYRRAVKIDPKYVAARTNLAHALDEQDQQAEAVKEYREVLKIDPDYAPARFNLALLLGERGDVPEGIEQLSRVIEMNPRDAEAHYELGRFLEAGGKKQEAAAEFRSALKLRPGFADAKESLEKLELNP